MNPTITNQEAITHIIGELSLPRKEATAHLVRLYRQEIEAQKCHDWPEQERLEREIAQYESAVGC